MKTSGTQPNKRPLLLALPLLLLALAACTGIQAAEGGSGVALDGDRLFAGTREGEVRAINPENGQTIWQFDLQGEEDGRTVYGEPAAAGDTVFAGGYDSILYALAAADGVLRSRDLLDDGIVASPSVADGAIIVGDSAGNVIAYDATDPASLVRKWTFRTGDKVWSTPAVSDGVAYFGSLDHNFYAVDLETGQEKWRYDRSEGAIAASPLVHNGRVYFGSFDKIFYALDALTGQVVWQFDGARNWYWAKAITDGTTIYAPSLDNNLYALDINTGALKWTLETGGAIAGSPALVGNDKIAVPSDDGRLRIARLADGVELADCNIGEQLRTPIVAMNDVIYFGVRPDSSIRALRVKADGNPDELWAHFTNRDNPLQPNRQPDC
ncbi:MAG: PQQ-binding-like beta-propeller repeat protein [Chloroflexi bacterium]|nr:PQQ-binding-like beta-propeller repeat protein [Chloroflexota bacterium]